MTIYFKKLLEKEINRNISIALKEDIGKGDLTANFIEKNSLSIAKIFCNENAIFCGKAWLNKIIKKQKSLKIKWHVKDGDSIQKDHCVCEISGSTREILSIERVCLNFIQTLSGTSTLSNQFVNIIKKTESQIYDTRKTIPGMRFSQKYAVKVGGGSNQRLGLFDMALFKENHFSANETFETLLKKIKTKNLINSIQIEVENLNQLKIALKYSVKNILLDNFSHSNIKKAIGMANKNTIFEISGNVNQKTVLKIAELGKLRISIGALTKNIQAIDFSMLIEDKKSHAT
ncbi:MAG: carboxylating nicotinate-nucleotide diphosphorylase [Methylophilaceae bacterium]